MSRDALEMYRQAHERVARYTVIRSEWWPVKRRTTIKRGLSWADAKAACDQLNSARENPRFGDPAYVMELENQDEALAAVREASGAYWQTACLTAAANTGGCGG